jgi:DNA-binding MarR family transcriptional regulator
MPLERVQRLAAFRRELTGFLRESETVARRWGLTPQRYLLLLAIKGADDGGERLNMTQIADQLQLSKNTVTELVARAEEAGLLAREGSEADGRVVYLRLTDEGERRLRGALLESDSSRRELTRAFTSLAEAFKLTSP